jgi:hypothetical protein
VPRFVEVVPFQVTLLMQPSRDADHLATADKEMAMRQVSAPLRAGNQRSAQQTV